MRRTRSALVAVIAVLSVVALSVQLRAIVPIDSGTLSVVLPVTINAGSGDNYDPHVDGDVASYTSDPDGIRYYDFVTGFDVQVPHTANSVNQLSDVSKGKIVFSHLDFDTPSFSVSIRVFDTATATITEVDPQVGSQHSNGAIGSDTVAFVDTGLAPTGELVASQLGGSTVRVTNDSRVDQAPSVAPSGNVIVYESCQTSAANCDVRQATWSGATWVVSNLTNNAEPESNPDTDGALVVYDAIRSGERDIYWQPAGGGSEQRLQLTGEQRNPSISGGLIVFESVAPSAASADLFVYQVASNRLFRVTSTPADETLNDISVLPNGQFHLVWTSGTSGNRNVLGATIEVPPTSGGTYSFSGFRAPVEPVPTVNLMKAGGAVPVKFSLGGFQGLDIFAPGNPKSSPVSCSAAALTVGIVDTVSPGGSALQYDAATDTYAYIWKTDKSWAGTCRQLVIQFADASVEYANFQFK
jgi:hypothetical protein